MIEQTQEIRISSMETYLEENTDIELYHEHTPAIVSGVSQKPPQAFRDLLKVIKNRSGRNTTINTF